MRKQNGFTLIEIIAVIVVLGILAAVALPRFVNLSGEARIAKMQGAVGAVQSASVLIHAKYLANQGATTWSYEGGTLVASDLSHGYPTANVIATVAGLSANDYTVGTVSGTSVDISDTVKTTCKITYTEATASDPPAVTVTALTSANCQ